MLTHFKGRIGGCMGFLLVLAAACGMAPADNARAADPPRAVQAAQPADATPQRLFDSLAAALNRGDPDAAAAVFDASAVVTLPGGREFAGIDRIRELWRRSIEQSPAHITFSGLRQAGDHVQLTATIAAKQATRTVRVSALLRGGLIHTYTVERADAPTGPIASEQGQPVMGTVLSVHMRSPAPAASQPAGSAGVKTLAGQQVAVAGAASELPTPQFTMTIKLQDGRVISLSQAESREVGEQVLLVSVAGSLQAIAANDKEALYLKDADGQQFRNRLHWQTESPSAQPKVTFAPSGVFYASWDQYQGFPTRLMPASDGVCFLQGVTGNFRGGGEGVWVRNNGGFWELNGMSRQQSVAARAMCVPFSAILGANQGISYLIGTASAWTYYGGCSWWETCHSASAFQNLFGLDGFCYLTGMGGAFNGGGEIVSANAWAPDHWYIMVNTQVEGASIIGEAGCLALVGHQRLRTTNVVYRYSWSQGQPPVQLPNADQAFCALDWITGHFAGWGESIDIVHNADNTQWLTGTSYQQGVAANASCMYYDQRQ